MKNPYMRLVDSQIHLFEPGAEELARRLLQVLITPEQVIAEMDDAGVEKAYLVPANSAANSTCIDASRRWPDRFRVMGNLKLDKLETRALVERWDQSGLLGVRLVFPPYRESSWLKDGTAEWFWPRANELALPVMIWAPQQTEEIGKIAARHPRIRFVIDHMNLFVEDRGEVITRAVDELLPLAGLSNVAVKVSALPAHSNDIYPFRDTHAHIERVLASFGSSRTFWGTDMTRQACPYRQAVTMFTEELGFMNENELRDVMGEAVLRWIGW